MSTADLLLSITVPIWNEALFQLQLHVARRADELAAGTERSRDCDREIWFQAECEVMGVSKASMVAPAAA